MMCLSPGGQVKPKYQPCGLVVEVVGVCARESGHVGGCVGGVDEGLCLPME